MKLKLTRDKKNVVVEYESAHEYKWLKEFPGLLQSGSTFYMPSKLHIVYNIYQRLRTQVKNLGIDEGVKQIVETPFKLPELPEDFKFITEPLVFQRIALRYLLAVDSGGLLLDPGMGKSKIVLDWIALKKFRRSLIICPKPLLFVWEDEISTHRHDKTFHTVKTTDPILEKEGILKAEITIINYSKAAILEPILAGCGFDFIHLDEFLIKDPTSSRTGVMTRLSEGIDYKCGGSGTLVNNSIEDIFAPIRYLERCLVGSYLGNFQKRYCVYSKPKKNDPRKITYVVGYQNHAEAKSILESCCIVMTKDEWLKLPPKTFHYIEVNPTPEQEEVYYDLVSNYACRIGGEVVTVDNPLVMLLKLQQISNGFLYQDIEAKPEEILLGTDAPNLKKKRKTHFFKEQPKIGALRKLLTETLPKERAIIWFNMDAEFQLIEKLLTELGIKHVTIRGGEKSTGEKVRTFNKDTTIKYALCQAKSVNYGITVLGSIEDEDIEPDAVLPRFNPEIHTEIFYSITHSLEVFLQQQDRIHRIGQKHPCSYYLLFSNTPSELALRKAIDDKMVLRKATLVDIALSIRENFQNTAA